MNKFLGHEGTPLSKHNRNSYEQKHLGIEFRIITQNFTEFLFHRNEFHIFSYTWWRKKDFVNEHFDIQVLIFDVDLFIWAIHLMTVKLRKTLIDFGRKGKQFNINLMNRHTPLGIEVSRIFPSLITMESDESMLFINANIKFLYDLNFADYKIYWFQMKVKWKQFQCSERILTIKLITMRSLSKWKHSKSIKSALLCPFNQFQENNFYLKTLLRLPKRIWFVFSKKKHMKSAFSDFQIFK